MSDTSFKTCSKTPPKMSQEWNQNPQKLPPEGDLKTEPPKKVKNDPKLLPKGSQMETPGGVKNGSRGSGGPYPVGAVPITGLMC